MQTQSDAPSALATPLAAEPARTEARQTVVIEIATATTVNIAQVTPVLDAAEILTLLATGEPKTIRHMGPHLAVLELNDRFDTGRFFGFVARSTVSEMSERGWLDEAGRRYRLSEKGFAVASAAER